jgi:hypothetical protein
MPSVMIASAVCLHRNLLRSSCQRGHGVAMEVLDGRSAISLWDGLRGTVFRGPPQDEAEQSSDPGPRASSACDRGLAASLEGLLAGGPDVPNIRTGGPEGTGGTTLGEELPSVAYPSNRPQAGHSRPARHISGDATDIGNRHAATWDAQGHAGHVAAREYQDHGRRLRSDDRTERSRGSQLAYVSGARRLEDAGGSFGLEGEKSERSE